MTAIDEMLEQEEQLAKRALNLEVSGIAFRAALGYARKVGNLARY